MLDEAITKLKEIFKKASQELHLVETPQCVGSPYVFKLELLYA
jgi:hypothetical protein